MSSRAVVMKPADNVATALSEIDAGAEVLLDLGEERRAVRVAQRIPFGHKFAVADIARGAPVVKYGQVIGTASEPIGAGEHAHVHNIESNRGRGDRR